MHLPFIKSLNAYMEAKNLVQPRSCICVWHVTCWFDKEAHFIQLSCNALLNPCKKEKNTPCINSRPLHQVPPPPETFFCVKSVSKGLPEDNWPGQIHYCLLFCLKACYNEGNGCSKVMDSFIWSWNLETANSWFNCLALHPDLSIRLHIPCFEDSALKKQIYAHNECRDTSPIDEDALHPECATKAAALN